MRVLPILCLAALAAGSPLCAADASRAPAPDALVPNAAERDARLAWWREARFGMFVHWGVSSYLGGSWEGKQYGGYAEHIQRARRIPMAVYRKEVVEKFNPTQFNADEWIRLAKDTGMGYFIITAKHHDGFAMFDSKASAYNVVQATPWKQDPMVSLRDACRRHGIRFGFYYSHAFDWGEENGPGNDWDWKNPGGDRLLNGADWWVRDQAFLPKARQYVDTKAIPQLLELIRNYDPDILWFDTPHKLPPEENLRILAAVRKAKPSIVVNGRVVTSDLVRVADYKNTADKPSEFSPQDGDWEGIPTTNESYGYNAGDRSHKSPEFFIRLLAKAAARGGNILLNVGPTGDGIIDPRDVKILRAIGDWWKVNGESIRGTTRTPLPVQAWGESTRKGNTLFLHVFDWPTNGTLVVSGLRSDARAARILGSPAQVETRRLNAFDLVLSGLPSTAPHAADTVIALEFAAEPSTDPARLLTASVSGNALRAFDAKLSGGLTFGPGKSSDAWVRSWTNPQATLTWPVRLNEPLTFNASLVYDAPIDTKRNRVVNGDAGKELLAKGRGAAGEYVVHLGTQSVARTVRTGINVTETLGRFTLPAGTTNLRITGARITGEELFRPRRLVLRPVNAP